MEIADPYCTPISCGVPLASITLTSLLEEEIMAKVSHNLLLLSSFLPFFT